MGEFPTRAEDVSADWLTSKLRSAGALVSGEVSLVEWEPIGTGQVGDSARFHLSYAGGEGPATLAGKFPAQDQTSRTTAAMMNLYAKEVTFYSEIAAKIDVRTARVITSEIAENLIDYIILFEDLGPAKVGNQLEGCSIEQARAAIRQAAAIHAPSWNRADIIELPILHRSPELTEQLRQMYPAAQQIFAERYGSVLEPEYLAICRDLGDCFGALFNYTPPDTCLVHGDFRLDNMLFDIKGGQEEIAIVDWQTVTVNHPMSDIGFFMGCGIGDDLRRAHEEELLVLYLGEMSRRGVILSREEIQYPYRLGALHGVSTAVFSAAFVERTERGDANFLSMARGACALALKHDSIGALKELA